MSDVLLPTTEFDHAVPLPRAELLAWRDRLQEGEPIVWSPVHGGMWVVSRHQDVSAVALDTRHFISSRGITIPPLKSPVPVIPAESDAPMHVHYRAVLIPFLTPKAVRDHTEDVRRIVQEALDGLVSKGGGDAVSEFAALIPARAMASVFGFSDADGFRFDRDFTGVINAAASGDPARQQEAVTTFFDFLREKLEERRADPSGADVVSAILRYDAGGRPFTEEEMIGLLWSTAGGAVDTTKHAIGHALYNLGLDLRVRRRLIEEPALIPTAVEEVLRLDAPAYVMGRVVAEDVELGGVAMKAGDRVLCMSGWANRDPRAFDRPDELDVARKPNKHLSFGYGPHQCAGMHLARLEIRLALEAVLMRIPNYRLAGEGMDARIRGGLMWAFDTLPIHLA